MNKLGQYSQAEVKAGLNFELTEIEVVDELENIRYTTYGICVSDRQGNTVYAAHDIDTRKECVQRFVDICAREDVSVIHIPDLLEDYLD